MKHIKGQTEDEVWKWIDSDLKDSVLEYHAVIEQGNLQVKLDFDIDPGGGFESGYSYTSFTALVPVTNSLRMAIHRQEVMDELGKFLGMEDVVIGYPEFD